MAILVSVVGIAIACLAAATARPVAIYTTLALGLVGVTAVMLAMSLGAGRPKTASALYRASILMPVAIGAGAAAIGIWAAAAVGAWKGTTPTPWIEALSGAAAAAVGLAVERARVLSALMPEAQAERSVRYSYGRIFPQLTSTETPAYKLAYQAIFLSKLSDERGAIIGWGYEPTHRRLSLIARGLAERS
jgi:hypothetical protein